MRSLTAPRVFSRHCFIQLSLVPVDITFYNTLKDTHFYDFKKVQKFVKNWINSKEESFYRRKIHLLPERWGRIIKNKGKYFD